MIKRFLFSLVVAFVIALTGITVFAQPAQAALAFHSGYEGGNTFEWTSVTGTPTIQSTIKKTGSYAMRINISASQAYVSGSLAKAVTFYLYIATTPGADTYILGTNNGFGIVLNTDRTLSVNSATGTKRITGTTVLALITWYRVSVSSSSVVPSVKLFLNGTQEGDTYGAAMTFAGNFGIVTVTTADLYFDDYASDDANQIADIGDIRTLLSRPDAAGDLTEFDTYAGSATHYENVDDVPGSVDDADYNQHAIATNKADLYNLQGSSTIGVGAGDTINAVRSFYRMKRGGGGGAVHQSNVKDNGTEYADTRSLGTGFVWYSRYDAVMPNDSATWTQGRFDAFQAGARHANTGAQDTLISALMVMVAYTPASGTPDISVNPTSYGFGVVAVSSTPSTATNYFTITNNSTIQTDQTISVTTSSWSGGVTWTHSDTATAGVDTAGMKANRGGTWGVGDIIIKNSSPNYIYENCPASTGYSFGLKLIAPTEHTDGVQKQIIVRVSAVAG